VISISLSAGTYMNFTIPGILADTVPAYAASSATEPKGGSMGGIRTEDGDRTPSDRTDESHLRGGALDGPEQKKSVAHTAYEKARNPDATLHLDDEEDTLYDDGLEIEDDSSPLTGKDGRDDTA
jgi:hypothetical protein